MVITYKLFIVDFDHQFDNIGLSNMDLAIDVSTDKGLIIISQESTYVSQDKNKYIEHMNLHGWRKIDL